MDPNINSCLCYTKEKGLFTKTCNACVESILPTKNKSVYQIPYIFIPDEDFKATIHSHNNRKHRYYLYAEIKRGNRLILDFDKEHAHVLNKSSITRFAVKPEDWDTLFKKIAKAYNESKSEFCPASAIGYFDELQQMLISPTIFIKGDYVKENYIEWKDRIAIMSHVGDKIRDLIDAIGNAEIVDETLNNHLLNLGILYLETLRSIDFTNPGNREERIARTISYLGELMCSNGKGCEFLNYFNFSNKNLFDANIEFADYY